LQSVEPFSTRHELFTRKRDSGAAVLGASELRFGGRQPNRRAAAVCCWRDHGGWWWWWWRRRRRRCTDVGAFAARIHDAGADADGIGGGVFLVALATWYAGISVPVGALFARLFDGKRVENYRLKNLIHCGVGVGAGHALRRRVRDALGATRLCVVPCDGVYSAAACRSRVDVENRQLR
jgi:hypothetical protein